MFPFSEFLQKFGIAENELIRAKPSGLIELDELYPMVLFAARSDKIWIKTRHLSCSPLKIENLFLFLENLKKLAIPENELIRAKISGLRELDELYPMVLFSARSDKDWIKNSAFIDFAV